jgi:hypothetical protein
MNARHISALLLLLALLFITSQSDVSVNAVDTGSSLLETSHSLTLDHPLDYAVYFNERATWATSTTAQTTPMEAALLDLINGATTSIDAAIYSLSRHSVIEALKAAHNRGVTVRVVGDARAATGGSRESYQALVDGGIPIITDTVTNTFQHNKFLVFDDAVVWTGSTNLTSSGLTLNANNSIVITDALLASVYTTEFEEMWAGNFHDAKTDNTPHLLDFDGTLLESYFSPTDGVASALSETLGYADEAIHFAMYYWTYDLLTDRVIDRLNAGVAVYGMLDQRKVTEVFSEDEDLIAAGVQIRIDDFAGLLHHKFAIIDVAGSDPTVILGSCNWTKSGTSANDENTLIIHDRDLARAYYDEWLRLWAALGPVAGFSAPTYTVPEGAGHATITVTLSTTSTDTLTVDWNTAGCTATAASDFLSTTGTLTFTAGITTQTFTVPILDDTLPEPDETVLLRLSNAIITGTNPVTLTILDDDPYHPAIGVSDLQVTSGQAITISVDQHPPELSPYQLLWTDVDGAAIEVISPTLKVDAYGSRRGIRFTIPWGDWGTRVVETRRGDVLVARSASIDVALPYRIYLPLILRHQVNHG